MGEPRALDRAAGVLVGQGVGDVLGVPYEFGSRPLDPVPQMLGGGLGGFTAGEWSDDTAMAVCVAEVAATGADLCSRDALDQIALGFERWFASGPPDVGIQTRAVLLSAGARPGSPSERVRAAAVDVHQRTGRSGGNGSLMRTAVVGLSRATDASATARAARAVSSLTHVDPLAGDACVLWSEAVRRAVTGSACAADVLALLDLTLLPRDRRAFWDATIAAAAEARHPSAFPNNGYVVTAFQAALSALLRAECRSGEGFFVDCVTLAVHAGHDTDTVAAIAGGLAGALVGRSALPSQWADAVHGYPGLRASDLDKLAVSVLGLPDSS